MIIGGQVLVSARFVAKITPTATETYTIRVSHDNGARVYIDNVMEWDWLYLGSPYDHSFTIPYFQSGQTYEITVEWRNAGGPSNISLYWSHGTTSEVLIPYNSNGVNLEQILTSTPATITVLPPICGNGHRHEPEE